MRFIEYYYTNEDIYSGDIDEAFEDYIEMYGDMKQAFRGMMGKGSPRLNYSLAGAAVGTAGGAIAGRVATRKISAEIHTLMSKPNKTPQDIQRLNELKKKRSKIRTASTIGGAALGTAAGFAKGHSRSAGKDSYAEKLKNRRKDDAKFNEASNKVDEALASGDHKQVGKALHNMANMAGASNSKQDQSKMKESMRKLEQQIDDPNAVIEL